MFDLHFFELLVLVLSAAGAFGFYWLIRLAVRHGVLDARRRSATTAPPPPTSHGEG